MAQAFSFPNYGLFNATYYLQQNPDVATSWTGTPLQHYIQFGALEGRAPTAWFNADFYRASYTDLQSMNALQLFNHYCNFGYNEGRVPMLNFSNFAGARYLLDNPDVAAAGYTAANAISHYVNYGEYEGRVAYAQNGVVINPVVNEGDLYTLTTRIDNFDGTQFNDTFDASEANTLQSFDSLDGMGGVDTLYAVFDNALPTTVTPAQLSNMEVINATAQGGAATTLNLQNGGQVTNVGNQASTANLIVSNIAAGADLSVSNTGSDTTFDYATTAGTQTVDLTVDGVTGGATITVDGVETINTTAVGNDSDIVLAADAANTLNFAGDANLVVGELNAAGTLSVSLIDASDMTGDFAIATGAQTGVQSTTDVTVLGGLGDDSITLTGLTQDYTVTLGAGDDIVIDTGVTVTDSIAGGLGEDTLSTTAANAATLSATTPTTYNITGMDQLTLSTALAGQNIRTQNIDTSIDTVNVAGGTGTLTMGAGSAFVNLNAALTGALTVVDTGAGITDTVTIADADDANANVFGGKDITSTGYENVVLDVSNGVWSDKQQTIGTLSVTADVATAPVSDTLTGDNDVRITAIATNSTGLTTIDASALTSGTDTPFFRLDGTTLGTGGTQSVIGSAGDDVVDVGNFASTIVAGAGDDTITGGTVADSIDGGTGDDSLVGAGGNDTIHGGAGNDTIDVLVAGTVSVTGGEGDDLVNVGATITAGDVLDGGAGTNTLAYSQQVIAAYAGATNFQTLRMDKGVSSQNVALFTGTAFSEVELNHDATFVVSGLADATTVSALTNTNKITLSHATDTTSNTLTLAGLTAADATLAAVVANDTDALTITGGDLVAADVLTITSLEATDVDSITISGVQDTSVTLGGAEFGATDRTVTVNASGATGAVTFDATSQADTGIALAITGSATAANVLIGGAGNDVITGGTAADSLVGNAGNDTINAGTGAVEDTVEGGTGIDIITLNVDGASDHIDVTNGDSVAVTTISAGAIAAGSTLTFAAGVDVINNFLAGTGATADHIHMGTNSTALTSLIGATGVTATATAATEYYLSGSYNSLTGVFTVANNGAGADTLVLNGVAATTLATNAQSIILIGVNSADLDTANFVA